jgi:hypothetical protein
MKAFDPVGCAAGHANVAKMAACSFCLGAMLDISLHGEMSAFELLRRDLLSVDIPRCAGGMSSIVSFMVS